MKWKRNILVGALFLAGIGSAAQVIVEANRQVKRERPRTLKEVQPPKDVLDPSSAAIRLTGRVLEQFRLLPQLAVGQRAPRLSATDSMKRDCSVPAEDGRATICLLSDGGLRSAAAIHDLADLADNTGAPLNTVVFVANNSDYVWHHHGATFHRRKIHLVRDLEARALRRMRAPGKQPFLMPVVWASDARGVIRSVGQPDPNSEWIQQIRRALKLPGPEVRIRG